MADDGSPSSTSAAASSQPFHEALLAEQAPSVSDPATRAAERATGVNFRDLHSVSPLIQPGRVFRSSQTELEGLGVRGVLDLRQPSVPCKLEGRNLRQRLGHTCAQALTWLTGLLGGGGGGPEQAETPPSSCHRCTSACCEAYGVPARVYHVDLLPRSVTFRILWELPRGIKARVLLAAAQRKHPEPIVAGAVADPHTMGYLQLYRLLLEGAQGRLADALRLAADASNLPLMIHCIHGKDRTGLLAMLLLLLCDVERQAVITDYALSEALLRESREKRELLGFQEHLTTDQVISSAVSVMQSTIAYIEQRYGSAFNYARAIGLSEAELAAIRRNLTDASLAVPTAPAPAACSAGGAGGGNEGGGSAGAF